MPETNKNVQTKITDIYEKYHASVKNFGNYVENSSYIIDTANNQDFSNIANFLCTAFFKDSTAIENSETELSTEFGNILIDYCEKGLSHENILSLLNELKMEGFSIYASAKDGKDVKKLSFADKKILIMGSEGFGLPKKILKKSDEILSIKMKNDFDSLNVNAAFSILCDRIVNG